jgi:hypothetical protein
MISVGIKVAKTGADFCQRHEIIQTRHKSGRVESLIESTAAPQKEIRPEVRPTGEAVSRR